MRDLVATYRMKAVNGKRLTHPAMECDAEAFAKAKVRSRGEV